MLGFPILGWQTWCDLSVSSIFGLVGPDCLNARYVLGVNLVKLEVPLTPRPLVAVIVTFDGLSVVVGRVSGASLKF